MHIFQRFAFLLALNDQKLKVHIRLQTGLKEEKY